MSGEQAKRPPRLSRKPKRSNYPLTSVHLQRLGNSNMKIGVACMQGYRDNMEDAHVAVLQLPSHPNKSFVGVFDGHSGSGASLWCSKNFHRYMDNITNFSDENITKCIFEADSEFINTDIHSHGSTAVMALIDFSEDSKNVNLTIINIGDSRCVIGKSNSEYLCVTTDHKPELQTETDRITNAGGFVARNRVDGFLSVSRSIGDSGFKTDKNLAVDQQKVVCSPDIFRHVVTTDDFVLLCCDGIFETTLTNETAIDCIRNNLRHSDDPAYAANKLIEEALRVGSQDNLSAILIQFKDGSSYSRENEFIAGPWHEQGNETFVKAYKEFAERFDLTLEEAKQIWEAKKSNASPTQHPPPTNSVPQLRTSTKRGGLLKLNIN